MWNWYQLYVALRQPRNYRFCICINPLLHWTKVYYHPANMQTVGPKQPPHLRNMLRVLHCMLICWICVMLRALTPSHASLQSINPITDLGSWFFSSVVMGLDCRPGNPGSNPTRNFRIRNGFFSFVRVSRQCSSHVRLCRHAGWTWASLSAQ